MQLKTQWIHDEQVAILRGNTVVAAPKVRYIDRHFIHTQGNTKTKKVVGIINNTANGCMRALTGFDKCEIACYDSCCYANQTIYALKHRLDDFNVISNGVKNDFLHINIPENNNYKLNTLKIWRIGSETSDMSLALSLGLVEPWLKANPDKYFTGISSDYFFVPAKELKKLTKYENLVVGHTVSVWFGEDDLANRFKEIERYQNYGIPTVVWLATKKEWIEDKKQQKQQNAIVKKILKLVEPNQIIEVPFHYKKKHDTGIVNINPDGVCCENGVCKGCKILCGVRFLRQHNKLSEAAAA